MALDAKNRDSLILVAPSDHVIPDAEGFRDTVAAAVPTALAGQIVTFGIRPDRAETGYGWLELTTEAAEGSPPAPQPLRSFVEKPDAEAAEALLAGGMHLWNVGIFLFSTSTIWQVFAEYAPETLARVRSAHSAAETDLGFTRLAPKPWSELEDISIDYAVMERAPNLSVMPYSGAWSDLGDWQAIWREGEADIAGVVTSGPSTALELGLPPPSLMRSTTLCKLDWSVVSMSKVTSLVPSFPKVSVTVSPGVMGSNGIQPVTV